MWKAAVSEAEFDNFICVCSFNICLSEVIRCNVEGCICSCRIYSLSSTKEITQSHQVAKCDFFDTFLSILILFSTLFLAHLSWQEAGYLKTAAVSMKFCFWRERPVDGAASHINLGLEWRWWWKQLGLSVFSWQIQGGWRLHDALKAISQCRMAFQNEHFSLCPL